MTESLRLFGLGERVFYPTYNARMISAEEVGRRFVFLPQFEQIIQPEHTLVLGPRGSGKTTLLKMLLRPAMRAWCETQALEPIELPYAAIYVPADTLWVKQLGSEGAEHGTREALRALVQAAFTTNVLHSMVETLEMLGPTPISDEAETLFVRRLAIAWRLSDPFPSFAGLKSALISRLGDIRALSSRLRLGHSDRDEMGVEFLHYHYVDQLHVGMSVVDTLLKGAAPTRWAICLDEMEILPDWLRQDIFSLLRSTNQRLLFKVSGSPLDHAHAQAFSPTAPQPASDLTVVKLWYAQGHEGRKFSRDLADRTVAEVLRKDVTCKYVLGTSPAEDLGPRKLRYQADQPFWKRLRAEAVVDPAVRAICRRYNIDPEQPVSATPEVRDSFLRKAAPLLLLRQEFRKDSPKATLRTRKVVTIYSGVPAVLDIADGNPRWLVAMLREMLNKWDRKGQRIPPHVQAQVTMSASKRYRAFLRMLPDSSAKILDKDLTLASLSKRLGAYFSNRMIKDAFTLDPVGSFTVDSSTKPQVLSLIRLGVSQGAFVYCDDDWNTIPDSPIGRRFRLGFLLAPTAKLPLRLYEAISLRECLSGGVVALRGREKVRLSQQDLFEVDA